MYPSSRDPHAAFEPHLWLKVERDIPRPIFPVALIGVANLLRIPLPRLFAYDRLHDYFIARHDELWPVAGGRTVTSYGLCQGYYYHYALGRTVEFDTQGHEVAHWQQPPPHYGAKATLDLPQKLGK